MFSTWPPTLRRMEIAFPPRVGIAGLGLIGGSLARALALRQPQVQVTGFDPDASAAQGARSSGAVHALAPDLASLAEGADLVVLCQPLPALLAALPRLAGQPRLPVLCDAGSVKQPVLEAARALGAARGRFVGAHPIAGKAAGGWPAAEATLFEGALVVVCEDGADADAAAAVRTLWRGVGARPVPMAAAHHDTVYAALSHLPQLLTWAYLDSLAADDRLHGAAALAGPGFASFTRLGRSNPGLWAGIAIQNREALLQGLDRLGSSLEEVRQALHQRDAGRLEAGFRRARQCALLGPADTPLAP